MGSSLNNAAFDNAGNCLRPLTPSRRLLVDLLANDLALTHHARRSLNWVSGVLAFVGADASENSYARIPRSSGILSGSPLSINSIFAIP
jgi:hypothetical protein